MLRPGVLLFLSSLARLTCNTVGFHTSIPRVHQHPHVPVMWLLRSWGAGCSHSFLCWLGFLFVVVVVDLAQARIIWKGTPLRKYIRKIGL